MQSLGAPAFYLCNLGRIQKPRPWGCGPAGSSARLILAQSHAGLESACRRSHGDTASMSKMLGIMMNIDRVLHGNVHRGGRLSTGAVLFPNKCP